MNRIIISILVTLALCQCSTPQIRTNCSDKTDTFYIDESVRDILHQYIKEHPKFNNIGLFFDWENDKSIPQLYGDGIYFVISEFDERYVRSNNMNLSTPMLPSFFCMDDKYIYVVPSVNIVKSGTFGINLYFKMEKIKGTWLVKCEWDYSNGNASKKIKVVRK